MITPTVDGVAPDAPIEVKPNGAKQSASPYRCDLLPPLAILAVAKILKSGAEKYGDNNWRGLTVEDNLNHALTHILAYMAGDKSDDHVNHAACRMLFAAELSSPKGNQPSRIGPCKGCGLVFEPNAPIHQFHGRNYHRSCLPPDDFPR